MGRRGEGRGGGEMYVETFCTGSKNFLRERKWRIRKGMKINKYYKLIFGMIVSKR